MPLVVVLQNRFHRYGFFDFGLAVVLVPLFLAVSFRDRLCWVWFFVLMSILLLTAIDVLYDSCIRNNLSNGVKLAVSIGCMLVIDNISQLLTQSRTFPGFGFSSLIRLTDVTFPSSYLHLVGISIVFILFLKIPPIRAALLVSRALGSDSILVRDWGLQTFSLRVILGALTFAGCLATVMCHSNESSISAKIPQALLLQCIPAVILSKTRGWGVAIGYLFLLFLVVEIATVLIGSDFKYIIPYSFGVVALIFRKNQIDET